MVGIFDSGVGGFCAYREVRRLLPRENILYLADRKNAPYGTKTEEEIIALTRADIKRLTTAGARKILIACCTASTIYEKLSREEREIALPIIAPAAQKAAKIGKRIAVIATNHTARSSAFSKMIRRFGRSEVFEFAEQRLVALVEGGCRDGRLNPECREEMLKIKEKLQKAKADTLILGCTHFSHLEGEFKKLLPKTNIISPAKEGAKTLVRQIKAQKVENGKVIYC